MFPVNPNNLLLLIDILTHSFNQQHMNTHKYTSFDTILTHKRTHTHNTDNLQLKLYRHHHHTIQMFYFPANFFCGLR